VQTAQNIVDYSVANPHRVEVLEHEDVSGCALRVHTEALHAAVSRWVLNRYCSWTDAPLHKCGLHAEGTEGLRLSVGSATGYRMPQYRVAAASMTAIAAFALVMANMWPMFPAAHRNDQARTLIRGEIFSRSTAAAGLLKNRLPGILQHGLEFFSRDDILVGARARWRRTLCRQGATDRINPNDRQKLAGTIAANEIWFGSPTRARTWDLRINSPSLYQLSYRGTGEASSLLSPTSNADFNMAP
jgi:hypothetical protein